MTRPPFRAGIQIDPSSFADRPVTAVLDELQEQMACDALMLFHQGALRTAADDAEDLLDRLAEPAAERGIQLIAQLGEFEVAGCGGQEGPDGESVHGGCVHDAGWRDSQTAWMIAVFQAHPNLAGGMFMHERQGPLTVLFNKPNAQPRPIPFCFCSHCCSAARERGLDPERARAGYQALGEVVAEAMAGGERPAEGWFIGIWRLLMRYPEILAWEQLFYDGLHRYRRELVMAIKAQRPEVHVGHHIQNHTMLYDFSYRAGEDPVAIASYADWIKLSTYPGVSGPRGRGRLRRLRATFFGDCEPAAARSVLAGIFGRDASDEADLDGDGAAGGFAPSWIGKELRRWRQACPEHAILNGLGIGIPGTESETETPTYIAACCRAGYEAGADGVLLSRNHAEMDPALIVAAGHEIRAAMAVALPV